jgi:hypothetical protein
VPPNRAHRFSEIHDASHYGVGTVSALITEMILRDERAVVPIGSLRQKFGVKGCRARSVAAA